VNPETGAKAKAATLDDIKRVISYVTNNESFLQIIGEYAYAAQFAFENGYNGVELSAAGNLGLLGQFLSERINKRTDQYGGSLENRSRLVIDIITEIR